MNSIISGDSVVHFSNTGYDALNDLISRTKYSKYFVIVDSNTHENCLGLFLSNTEIPSELLELIEIPVGESYKTIDTCTQVWQALSELEADRQSLVINLGGGVVTDLGGFVACTFKRGIDYINVPTSLLAMVDASVGGKTGVDLGVLKNQVGVIANGKMVLIDASYLNTLSQDQMKSGLAEMLKHGLIADPNYWQELNNLEGLNWKDMDRLIHRSVEIKNEVVTEDPTEKGLRKSLNFGHTLGHAIESYHLETEGKIDLLHGEAIAIGMVLESFLSYRLNALSHDDLLKIKDCFRSIYQAVHFNTIDIKHIIDLMKHDKKNSHGKVKFALLNKLGEPKLDCIVDNSLIMEAFEFYAN